VGPTSIIGLRHFVRQPRSIIIGGFPWIPSVTF